MTNYHITKTSTGWGLKKEDATRATKVTETKAEILEYIKGGFSLNSVSVKIHKVNGEFQEERTYPKSSDPRKTKG
jgi:hypothetical protein